MGVGWRMTKRMSDEAESYERNIWGETRHRDERKLPPLISIFGCSRSNPRDALRGCVVAITLLSDFTFRWTVLVNNQLLMECARFFGRLLPYYSFLSHTNCRCIYEEPFLSVQRKAPTNISWWNVGIVLSTTLKKNVPLLCRDFDANPQINPLHKFAAHTLDSGATETSSGEELQTLRFPTILPR